MRKKKIEKQKRVLVVVTECGVCVCIICMFQLPNAINGKYDVIQFHTFQFFVWFSGEFQISLDKCYICLHCIPGVSGVWA